jgi:hypothetical protein
VWEVDVTLVEAWLLGLDQDSYQLVVAALELLEERGPQLGRPLADSENIPAQEYEGIASRVQGRSELRILYAFDVKRSAILFVAGDKHGKWDQWYRVNVPLADELLDEHLRKLKGMK